MPKGVEWRHKDLLYAALQGGNSGGDPITEPEQIGPLAWQGDGAMTLYAAPPFIHGTSIYSALITFFTGGKLIVSDSPSYDAAEMLAAIPQEQVQVLGHEGITQGDKDFTPILTKIKALNPDLLYFAGMFPEGALLIRQRADIRLGGRFMGGNGLFDAALITLATPETAEGVYLTTIGSDIHQIPTAQGFVNEYEERFGPIGAYSAYAYEATNIAIWAIRQAGVKDRAAVLKAMRTLTDFPGLFGPQNFDEKGDSLIRDIGIFVVRDGQFEFMKTAAWD